MAGAIILAGGQSTRIGQNKALLELDGIPLIKIMVNKLGEYFDNIYVVSEAVKIPILRPLIGDNKNDIIDLASEIGTYEISAQPYEDCCSLFLPLSPETHGKLDMILEEEKKLDVKKMIQTALDSVEIFNI